MDFTMLHQISRHGHASALLHDNKDTSDLASILEPEHLHNSYISAAITNAEQAAFVTHSPISPHISRTTDSIRSPTHTDSVRYMTSSYLTRYMTHYL